MLISGASFAATAVTVVGSLVFWSNPHRIINRFFCSFSVHLALWLLCVHQAVVRGEDPTWIRVASSIGSFVPVHMWFVKEACIGWRWRQVLREGVRWCATALLLTAVCSTDWYVRSGTAGGPPHFGRGYFIYMLIFIGMYAVLCYQTARQMRADTGLPRLELQILLLGGSAMCFGIIFLMALRAIVRELWPIQMQPFVVLVFYASTVITITTHRVFNARQILLVGLQKFMLVAVALGIALLVDWGLEHLGSPRLLAWFLTAAVALFLAELLNRWLQRMLHFYPEGNMARGAAFAAAREMRVENLEKQFCEVLKGWGQSEHAIVLSGAKDALSGGGVEVAGDSTFLATMRQLRWVTPERLARERPSSERAEVGTFLRKHCLGALAISEGHALTVVAGVGVNAARRPFTYPQMTQLLELVSIMGSAMERAHFSVKAQHAEQLATVGLLGASLAHEIRNPLVSIKTFVQLLPTHHQDAAFREKFFRLISDEVSRIDQLTEQLLDLASPRAYVAQMVELHPIVAASIDLVAAKALHRNVRFLTDFNASPDTAFTDASAAKQVILNLCFNAIQAVESCEGDRWVKISTRNTPAGFEMVVADSGPGIAEEIRPHLFQPFRTTKSRGFGLGLAICRDILANLQASISVDPRTPGNGAAFRVVFPCQPSSS